MDSAAPADWPGRLILLVGPGGVGKTVLLHQALHDFPRLAAFVSATTRPPRRGERDGVHYRFMSPQQFAALQMAGEFAETNAIGSWYYGTLKADLEPVLIAGGCLIGDVDVNGARSLLALYGSLVRIATIFPSVPSGSVDLLEAEVATLKERMERRGDNRDVMLVRLLLARDELDALHQPPFTNAPHFQIHNQEGELPKTQMLLNGYIKHCLKEPQIVRPA